MANKLHVIADFNGAWSVRRSGAARATRVFPTKDEALAFAKAAARRQRGELYVHDRDGAVREKTSYLPLKTA